GAVVPAVFHVRGRVAALASRSPRRLLVDGAEAPVEGGRFDTTLRADRDGPKSFSILYGEVGKPAIVLRRSVEVDATAPALEILEPDRADFVSRANPCRVAGRATDPHLARV